MPRKPPIRSRQGPFPPESGPKSVDSAERRAWLSKWKEDAVRALPPRADSEARVRVRQEVEQALAGFGPEDAREELSDIVKAIVDRAKASIEKAEQSKAANDARKALLEFAESLLVLDVNRLQRDLVGDPDSNKRIHVLTSLREDLRDQLNATLTGEETAGQIIQQVRQVIANWVVEQNPRIDRHTFLRNLLKWGVPTAVAAVTVATQVPVVREAVDRGAHVIRERFTSMAKTASGVAGFYQEMIRAAGQQERGKTQQQDVRSDRADSTDETAQSQKPPVRRFRRPRTHAPAYGPEADSGPAEVGGSQGLAESVDTQEGKAGS